MQSYESGCALHAGEEIEHTGVRSDGKLQPAIDGDAVHNPEAPRVSQRLLEGQATLQVSVIIHDRIALLVHLQQLAINVVHLRQLVGRRLQVIGQGFEHQIAERHFGHIATAFESDGTVAEGWNRRIRRLGGLDVIDDRRAVQPNLRLLVSHLNAYLEPSVVIHHGLVNVADAVKRAGLAAVEIITLAGVDVVDLHLEARLERAVRLKLRVEVNARTRPRARQHFHLQIEVLEISVSAAARVEKVRARSDSHDVSVFNAERLAVLSGFPAVKRMTVKQTKCLVRRREVRRVKPIMKPKDRAGISKPLNCPFRTSGRGLTV